MDRVKLHGKMGITEPEKTKKNKDPPIKSTNKIEIECRKTWNISPHKTGVHFRLKDE